MDGLAESPDHDLVAHAQRGMPDAYGELVRRYQNDVFRAIYRLVGDPQEALDLSQEAFVNGYRGISAFDRTRPFGPWIKRIAINLTLNWLQRRQLPTTSLTRKTILEGDHVELVVPDETTEPESVYLANEQRADLRQAILALPPQYRAVVELRHFQDCSYEEIAGTLNLPLSDVKSYLFRARQLLRKRLEGAV